MSGSSAGGKLSVAAAVGVALVGDASTAEILATDANGQPVARSVTGASLAVSATNTGDALATGNGATVSSTQTGIGVGAAFDLIADTTLAHIDPSVVVTTAGAVSVTAVSTQNQDDFSATGGVDFADRVGAEAASGAAGKKLAFAGSIAVAFSSSSTAAETGQGLVVQGTAPGTRAGAVSVTADNTASLSAKAWTGAYSSTGNSIGASVGLVGSLDSYAATVGANSAITAGAVTVSAVNHAVDAPPAGLLSNLLADLTSLNTVGNPLTLGSDLIADAKNLSPSDAQKDLKAIGSKAQPNVAGAAGNAAQALLHDSLLGRNNYYTEVIGGAVSNGKTAFDGAFALQFIDNGTTANVAGGSTVDAGGAVTIAASDLAVSKAITGDLTGGGTAIGVSGTAIVDTATVSSTLGTDATPTAQAVAATVTHAASVAVTAANGTDVDLFDVSAAGSTQNSGGAGALGVVIATLSADAHTATGAAIAATGAVAVGATSSFHDIALAGGFTLAAQSTVGGAAVDTTLNNRATAAIGSSLTQAARVTGAGVAVTAATDERIVNIGVLGAGGGANAIAGVVSPVTEYIASTAAIGDGATIAAGAGQAQAKATDGNDVVNVAGALAAANETAVGGSLLVTTNGGIGLDATDPDVTGHVGGIGSKLSTTVPPGLVSATVGQNARVTGASIDVEASAQNLVLAVTVAGAGAGTTAVAGAASPYLQLENVYATTGTGTILTAAGAVTVAASNADRLANVAGGVAVGGTTGVGAAGGLSILIDHTEAHIGDTSTVDAAGAVAVSATALETIGDVAVSGAGGGSYGVAIGLASSTVTDTTLAYIGQGSTVGGTTPAASVSVLASDTTSLYDLAGTLGAGGTVGAGAGADVDVLEKTTDAWLGQDSATGPSGGAVTRVTAMGDVVVKAASSQTVVSAVAGVGVGGDAGLAGSAGVYSLVGQTESAFAAGSVVLAGGNAAVLADNANELDRVIGAVGVGGTAGVGASLGVSVMNQKTRATIGDGTTVVALGDTPGLAVTLGYQGSFGAYTSFLAQAVPATPSFLTVPNLTTEDDTTTQADALKQAALLLVTDRSATPETALRTGVIVDAASANAMRSIVAAGGIGGTAGIALGGDLPVVIADTEARVGQGVSIDQSVPASLGSRNAGQSVTIAAASDNLMLGLAGALGGGGTAGIGGGLSTGVLNNTTLAELSGNGHLAAAGDVGVTATASGDMVGGSAAGGIGGEVGVSGAFTGLAIVAKTHATIDDGATVLAGGSVLVGADDQSRAVTLAGNVAIGVATAGVGVGGGVAVFSKDTQASIGAATVTALGNGAGTAAYAGTAFATAYDGTGFSTAAARSGVIVQANSGESDVSGVASGAAGLYAGVSGVISAEVMVVKTQAFIAGSAQIDTATAAAQTASGQTLDAAQSVVVAARDAAVVATFDGAVGGGIAGIGGAIDVAVLANTTAAYIGDGATVKAQGDVLVGALSDRDVSSDVLSAGIGIGGVSASVSLLAITNGPSADQQSQLSVGGQSVTGQEDGKTSGGSIGQYLAGNDSSGKAAGAGANTNSHVTAVAKAAEADKATYGLSIADALKKASQIPPGVSATIGSSAVTAGGTVGARTFDIVDTQFTDGSVAATIGFGGGIGITAVEVTNTATVAAGATITAGAVAIAAETVHSHGGVAAAGAGGFAGAVATITDGAPGFGTTAELGRATVTTSGSVSVQANDTTSVSTGTGALGVGVGGAGITTVVLLPTTTARIDDGAVVKAGTLQGGANGAVQVGDVTVQATSHDSLFGAGAGIAIGGFGAGAANVYVLTDKTRALLGDGSGVVGPSITATGNAAVLADTVTDGDLLVGSAALGGQVGIGASLGVDTLVIDTTAKVDGTATVQAYGLGATLSYVQRYDAAFQAYPTNLGKFDPGLASRIGARSADSETPVTTGDATDAGAYLLLDYRTAHAIMGSALGIVVNAANSDSLRTLLVSGGVNGASVNLSANVPVVIADTEALVEAGASLNQAGDNAVRAGTAQSVVVGAVDDFYSLSLTGSVAGGGVGIGAGFGAAAYHGTTLATIGDGGPAATPTRVTARNDVIVDAEAREDFAGASASAGVGGTALAGGISVITLNDTTEATIATGTTVAAGNDVQVLAADQTRTAIVTGALALGSVSAAGSLGVAVLTKDTEATVQGGTSVRGDGRGSDSFTENTGTTTNAQGATSDSFTGTQTGRGVQVAAYSGQSLFTVGVAGSVAVGGPLAAAGTVSIDVVTPKTLAAIDDGATVASAAGDVDVEARDSTAIQAAQGGAAVAVSFPLFPGAALAGAVDVGVIQTTVGASIGSGATVTATAGDVLVTALANKAISSNVVSASASTGVAVAAAVSVYSIGDGVDPNGQGAGQLQLSSGSGIGGYAGSQSSQGGQVATLLNSDGTSGTATSRDGSTAYSLSGAATAAGATAAASFGRLDVQGAITGNAALPGTSATIGAADGTGVAYGVAAGGSVVVRTLDTVGLTNLTGSLAGGTVGLTAGISVDTVSTGNTAAVGAGTVAGGSLSVAADTSHTIDSENLAGSAGLAVGGDAALGIVSDTSSATASLTRAGVTTAGAVSVGAVLGRTVTDEAKAGGIAGLASIGAAVATTTLGGGVSATVTGGTITAGAVTLKATAADAASDTTVAAQAGLGAALEAAVATATVDPTVKAGISGASITAGGAVLVAAEADETAAVNATGVVIAIGGAAGASVADASVAAQVSTDVSGATVSAGSIELDSYLHHAPASGPFVTASANGSSGALFIGIDATEASASDASHVTTTATNSGLTATGALTAQAVGITSQSAQATGLAVGIVAAGFNIAHATSNTVTTAILSDLTTLSAGSLVLNAAETDTAVADATSGSGGLLAGAAAVATTASTAETEALVLQDAPALGFVVNVAGGDVAITASHLATFSGAVDSTQAAVVGASGSTLDQSVTSDVQAGLGDTVTLVAQNLRIDARNISHNFFLGEPGYGLAQGATAQSNYDPDNAAWNIDSGSGGLVALPAGKSGTTITQTTTASIGKSANVHLLAPASGASTLFVEAYNEVIAHEKAQLNAGGLVAVAEADAIVTVLNTATVSFGDHAVVVVDVGDIEAGAWANADIDTRVAATTSGLAGAPVGRAYSNYTGLNQLTVGLDAQIQATDGLYPTDGTAPTHGTITLAAGDSPTDRQGALKLDAEVDLYNHSAIPISTKPDAQSNLVSNALVTIAQERDQVTNSSDPTKNTHYGVNAAGNILVSADQGAMTVTASGVGKNIYLEALSEAGSAVSELFGGGAIDFNVTGGSTSVSGTGKLLIDGLVDTSLQKDKVLTISYAQSNAQAFGGCDVSAAACLAQPTAGQIPYSVTGPQAVGADILTRLNQLQTLLNQYGQDPIAKGAYQGEIVFLQSKLVALGLGQYQNGQFVPGNFIVGKSPRDIAQAQLQADQTSLTDATASLQAATTVLTVTPTGTNDLLVQASIGSNLLRDYSAGANNDTSLTATANATSAFTTLKALSNYGSAANLADTTFQAYATSLTAGSSTDLFAAGQGYISAYASLAQTNVSLQSDIDAQTATIIADKGTGAAADAARAKIASDLAQIDLNTTAMVQEASNLVTNVNQMATALQYISNHASSGSSTDTANVTKAAANIQGLNTLVQVTPGTGSSASFGDLQLQATAITQLQTSIRAQSNALNGVSAGGSGTTTPSLQTLQGQIATLNQTVATDTTTVANASTALPSAPQAYAIDVPNTVAWAGNISLVGTSATSPLGTGVLSAPGNASITITNNTADTLNLGSLLIPDNGAGRVLFNGVSVNSPADIAALNPSGAPAGTFASVIAGETTRPAITIASTYEWTGAQGGSLYYQNHQQVAPDIVLQQGSTISNLGGAVGITSNSGNIYLNGSVQAGSISVLAKNGDLVTSYVNAIDNIAGDPASQIPLGAGMIANGAISISARYININGTIQSGIAQWGLTLAPTDLLTTGDLNTIGVTGAGSSFAATVNALETNYKNSLVNGQPLPATATYTDAQGNTATVYLTRDGSTPEVTFSTGFAKDWIAANPGLAGTLYRVITPATTGSLGAVGASYDPTANDYVLDPVTVHGGYVQIYGQILNTSATTGQINVLDGFGTIAITNTTGLKVVTSQLDAGTDPSGTYRGTAGVIDITDVHLDNALTTPTYPQGVANGSSPLVDVTHTVYTRDYDVLTGQGQVVAQQQTGYLDPNGNAIYSANLALLTGGSQPSNTGNRTSSYAPLAGQRYVYTDGTDYTAVSQFEHDETDIFHASSFAVDQTQSLPSLSSGPIAKPTLSLANGTYVTTLVTQTGSGSSGEGSNGLIFSNIPATQSNASLEGTPSVTNTAYYLTSTDVQQTGSHSSCNWWTLCIASNKTDYYSITQTYTKIDTTSLKADYGIGINFIGSDTGAVTVTSNSDILLGGAISAPAGSVTLTATDTPAGGKSSIVQNGDGASISGRNITLSATGSVGVISTALNAAAPNGPVTVNLTSATIGATTLSGALNAQAGNGVVAVTTAGDLRVGTITAGGDASQRLGSVSLTANKSIVAASGTSSIQADSVSLTAVNGSIGSTAAGQQLTVATGFTANQALRPFGDPATTPGLDPNPYYGLTAAAAGDIGIQSKSWADNAAGTMLLNTVVSTGGNVLLSSPGQILDNEPVQTVDTRNNAQLLAYWNTLGLTSGANNTANQQKTIQAFENGQTQAYDQYWAIRLTQADGGQAYDPNFQVTIAARSQQYAALSLQFAASIQAANPTIAPAALQSQVAAAIASYATAQTQTYRSLNGQVGTLTATFQAGFAYTASAAEVSALTQRATWTQQELAFALSAGALKTVTDTNTVFKAPNVSGRTVTIDADVGVGETVGAGTANPGVQIQANLNPANVTDAQKIALITAERSDLQLTVSGLKTLTPAQFTALSADQQAAYTAARNLGTVVIPLGSDPSTLTAAQQAALKAAADGFADPNGFVLTVLSKRPLNFAASQALNVSVTDQPNANVIDSGDAFLSSQGDARLGAVSVPGETRIKVLGSIYNASTPAAAIETGNIVLEAAFGNIGVGQTSNGPVSALRLMPRAGATITARAQNGITLDVVGTANIDTLYSPQKIVVAASNGITNANHDQLINILGSDMQLLATGGSIGAPGNALNVATLLGGPIRATATNGGVDLFGPSPYSFVVAGTTAAGNVDLTAAGDGTVDGTVVSTAGSVNLTAAGRQVLTANALVHADLGDVTVNADTLKMLNGALVQADARDVSVTTTGDALVTGIKAGGTGADAVLIRSGGHVFGGTNPYRVADIAALGSGGGVSITAALGIGDATEANDEAVDGPLEASGTANRITAVANPLRIATAKLDLSAVQGDVDATTVSAVSSGTVDALAGSVSLLGLDALHLNSVTAAFGNVAVQGSGAVQLDTVTAGLGGGSAGTITVTGQSSVAVGTATSLGGETITAVLGATGGTLSSRSGAVSVAAGGPVTWTRIAAGTDVQATSTGDSLTLGTVTGGGSATLQAAGAVGFGTITASGLVGVTARTGAILGGSIGAGRGVTLTAGSGATGQTVTATSGSISIAAGGPVGWAGLSAAGTVQAISAGAGMTLGTVTSGASQTLQAAGQLSYGTLTSNAGDIGASAGGGLSGGAISSFGSVRLTAAGSGSASALTAGTGDIAVRAGTGLSLGTVSASLGNVSLSTASGSLDFATLQAGKLASLTASAGDIMATGPGTATAAQDVILTAAGAVGGRQGAMVFSLGAGGLLRGTIGGAAVLQGTTDVAVEGLSATGALSLTAAGAIRVENSLSSATGALLVRGGSIAMDAGATASAAGTVTLSSAGDVILGQVSSAAGGQAITVTAGASSLGGPVSPGGGRIGANGDGAVSLRDGSAGASAVLAAGTSIDGLSIDIGAVTASTAAGDLSLSAASSLVAGRLAAQGGSLSLAGAADLSVSDAAADGTLTLSAAGHLALGTAASSGSMTLSAMGPLTFASLQTAGDLSATSFGDRIGGGDVGTGGSIAMAAAGDIAGGRFTAAAGSVTLGAGGTLAVSALQVGDGVAAHAGGALSLGTVAAGGPVVIAAAGDVALGSAASSGGSLWVQSGVGSIGFTSLRSAGALTLTAAKSVSGQSVASSGDDAAVTAGGNIDLAAASAAGTLSVTSTGGALNLGTGTGGAAATLRGFADVTFGTLVAQASDVVVGSASARVAGGTVTAAGSATVVGRWGVSGQSIVANGGSITLSSRGRVQWGSLGAARSLTVASSQGRVRVGSARSGGTLSIVAAEGVRSTTLRSRFGEVDVVSQRGGIWIADASAQADIVLLGSGNVSGQSLSAGGDLVLSAGGMISWADASATDVYALSGQPSIQLGGTYTLGASPSVTFVDPGTQAETGAILFRTRQVEDGFEDFSFSPAAFDAHLRALDLRMLEQRKGDLKYDAGQLLVIGSNASGSARLVILN